MSRAYCRWGIALTISSTGLGTSAIAIGCETGKKCLVMGAEFGARLAALRKKQPGLTQVKLAGEIGADPSAVSRWERGEGEPHLEHLRELSRFFGVTVDELISDGPFDDHNETEAFQKFLATSDGQYAIKRDWVKNLRRMQLPDKPTVALYRELVRVLRMAYYPEDD